MKKLFFVLFTMVIISISAYSVDLWNGFTTDMSKEQFISRVQSLYSPDRLTEGEGYYIPSTTSPAHDNLGFPRGLVRVSFYADIQEQGVTFKGASFSAYFYKDKLFFLKIGTSLLADRGVFLRMAREKYGNPQKSVQSSFGTVYYWALSDKDFYADNTQLMFNDRKARIEWLNG
jgi:hypothetical protein